MSGRVGQPTETAASTRIVELAPYVPALREHLREIIESPAFKGSRRSQQFLRHIVEKAIDGHSDDLKERVLGMELFGRPPSYDTGEDAIVRVTGSDVRKRLHQYYAETSPDSEIRIDLVSGSYVPEFRRVAASIPSVPVTAPPEARHSRPGLRRLALYVLVGLAIGVGIWLWRNRNSASGLSPKNVLPWSAIFHRDRQVQVVLSDPNISVIQELLGFHISLSDYANRRYVPDPQSLGADMQRVYRSFRGVDVPSVDVGIALDVARLAMARSQQVKTHTARSLQLGHFKTDDDFILLGSPRSNPWGGLFQDQLDFDFVYDENLKQEVIRNKRAQQGELALYVPTAKGWDTGQAFAIAAFIGNPNQSGQVLLLAGTNAEGTEAAGKLATNLDLLSRTLQRYGIDPNGPLRHFEALLQVRTMAGSPNRFEVIAFHHLPNGPLP